MKSGAQATIEFIVTTGLILTIFLVMGIIIYQKFVDSIEFRLDTYGVRIANSIADNINEICTVGEGYSQCFTLNGYLVGDVPYRITFFSGEPTVYVSAQGREWSSPLYSSGIACSLQVCTEDPPDRPFDVWVSNYGQVILLEDCGPCNMERTCAAKCPGNPGFEDGILNPWSGDSVNNGIARVVDVSWMAEHFGDYALNLSSTDGNINYEAILTSEPFIPVRDNLYYRQLSDSPDITLEYSILDASDYSILSGPTPISIIESGWGQQNIDLSGFVGRKVVVRFEQRKTIDDGITHQTLLDEFGCG